MCTPPLFYFTTTGRSEAQEPAQPIGEVRGGAQASQDTERKDEPEQNVQVVGQGEPYQSALYHHRTITNVVRFDNSFSFEAPTYVHADLSPPRISCTVSSTLPR